MCTDSEYIELQNLKNRNGKQLTELTVLMRGGKSSRVFSDDDLIKMKMFWFRKFIDKCGWINPYAIRYQSPGVLKKDAELIDSIFNTLHLNPNKDNEYLAREFDKCYSLRWLIEEWNGDLRAFWKTEVLDKVNSIWTRQQLEKLTKEEDERDEKIKKVLQALV